MVTRDRARFADLAEAPPPGWAGDPRAWAALRLHAVEGLSLRAAGERLGITGQRAHQLARRAAALLGVRHDELAVPQLGKGGLRAVRAAIPSAGEICPTCGGRGRV